VARQWQADERTVYTLELSQKFDFQYSTMKPDNKDHTTIEIKQI
jgi:hypothetical protein